MAKMNTQINKRKFFRTTRFPQNKMFSHNWPWYSYKQNPLLLQQIKGSKEINPSYKRRISQTIYTHKKKTFFIRRERKIKMKKKHNKK